MIIRFITAEENQARFDNGLAQREQDQWERMRKFVSELESDETALISSHDKKWIKKLFEEFGEYPKKEGTGFKWATLERSDMERMNTIHVQLELWKKFPKIA